MSALPAHPPAHWRDCPHGDDPATCPPCQRARQVRAAPPVDDWVIYRRAVAARSAPCPYCGRRIEPGDAIALIGPDRQDAEWAHRGCAEDVSA